MTSNLNRVEDCAPYLLMLGVGCIPVTIALSRHANWGVEPTVGLILVAVAVRALGAIAVTWWRQRRDRRSGT